MSKRCFLAILFLLIIPVKSFAYDNLTTHPALTSEMVKLYNNFSNQKISDEEKEWLLQGSQKEDDPVIRTLNHFYDPIYQRGLSGEINGGALGPILNVLKPIIKSAKEWCQNSYAQATFLGEAYQNAAFNPVAQITKSAVDILTVHTWEKAIYNYLLGNKQEAFQDLGHILHLLEDMAVPAHTRNDEHLTGDAYEKWASRFNPNNIDVVSQLKGSSFLHFNSLNEAFDYLATYTNTHFYSQDTIGVQSGYNQPECEYSNMITEGGHLYFILQDEFGDYRLARKRILSDFLVITTPVDISIDSPDIYQTYWSHLSKKAVLTGSAVINLFFQEVEKYRNDPNFMANIRKSLIATTLDHIKAFFSNLTTNSNNENQSQNAFEEPSNSSVPALSHEENNPVTLSQSNSLGDSLENEINNEISLIQPTPLLSQTPTPNPVPSPTPLITPTPFITPLPLISPSPTPTATASPTSSGGGSSSSSSSSKITFCTLASADSLVSSQKVIINEVAWMGTKTSANDEWIELKNISSEPVDITDWQLIVKDSQIKVSFPQKILAPNEFYLLERTNDDTVPNIAADLIFTGSINDKNEVLQLFDKGCQLQDEAKTNENGQWPAGDSKEKRTMERSPDFSWHTYSGSGNGEIYGTPKQENSPVINFNPTETPTPTLSVSPTPTMTPTPTPLANILISEFLYDAEGSDEGKEFIELYNPNESEIDLSDWSLQLIKSDGSTSSLGVIRKSENHLILPRGFFLIGYNHYSTSTYNIEADITRTSFTLPNPNKDEIFTIRLFNNEGKLVDEVVYQQNSCLAGLSLERKAQKNSTSESMINGEDQFLGNGYDSDSPDDFIMRPPQPQNSSSLPEPREKPPYPQNISYRFASYGLLLSFSLSQSVNAPLTFEAFYSPYQDYLSQLDVAASSVVSPILKITKADWANNYFEGIIENFPLANYYLVLRSKDKDGLVSNLSEIIDLQLPSEIINPAPVVFYSATDTSSVSGPNFFLGNWYGPSSFTYIFTSREDGYLNEISVLASGHNCSLEVSAKIYSVDNGEVKDLIAQSKSNNLINAYETRWAPRYFNWKFEDGEIILSKNQQYAIQFSKEYSPDGNCFANFYGGQQLVMDVLGYKTALNNLVQKTDWKNPVREEETIFQNKISFAAQIFSYNHSPVKLEVELRPRWENFNDQILKGDPHLFESAYLASGEAAEITVDGLADGAYHWRARVIDISGNPSKWYYYGDPSKYYHGAWESPAYDDQNNSDFYVDADLSDYPANALYYQPIAEDVGESPTFYSIYYGPAYRIYTFSPYQSGYVESAEVMVRYGYCLFPMSAELYSLSPNQHDGLPAQLLARSVDGFPHYNPYYTNPYFDSFQIDAWHFDQEVFLEAGHFYALKIKFSDNYNWGGMANCSVRFGIRRDANNSRVYTSRGGQLYLDFDEDLRLVIYKKDPSKVIISPSENKSSESEAAETSIEEIKSQDDAGTNEELNNAESSPTENASFNSDAASSTQIQIDSESNNLNEEAEVSSMIEFNQTAGADLEKEESEEPILEVNQNQDTEEEIITEEKADVLLDNSEMILPDLSAIEEREKESEGE